jgi:phosphoesterase RecJ-like protein
MPTPVVDLFRTAFEEAKQILVIAHVSPDGDAISSLTATGLALQQLGKEFDLVCDDGVPNRFSYLPLSDQVSKVPESSRQYDLLIAVDCGDTGRMGQAYAHLPRPLPPVINVDHHISNTQFGTINLVDATANATTEILFHALPKLGVILTPDLALCLLTGLVTDTLSFRTAGVTSKTLDVASALVEAGADLFNVTTLALNLQQISTLRVWQKGLFNMQMDNGLIWTTISDEERKEAGHNGTSSFGLGNMMTNVYRATMSAVLLELGDGRVSVGFRCRPPFSVSELAESLGGGGHHLAAGCMLDGPLEQAESLVIEKCKESIQTQQNDKSKESRGKTSNGRRIAVH